MESNPTPEETGTPDTAPPGRARNPSPGPYVLVAAFVVLATAYANLAWLAPDGHALRYFPPFVAGWNRLKSDHLGAEYFQIAKALRGGRGFADPFGDPTGPTAWMPPALPAALAGVHAVTGGSTTATTAVVVILQALALILAGGVTVAVARRVLGSAAGWPAAVLLVVGFLLDFELAFQLTHDGWLQVSVLAGMVVVCSRLPPAPTARRAAAWGVVGGAGALVGPVLGLAWCGLTASVWGVRCWREWLAAVAAAVLVCLPWVGRNYATFGTLVPIKSNLPFDLYQAQCLTPDGLVRSDVGLPSHPYSSAVEQARYAGLGEREYLAEKWGVFRQAVAADPGGYATRVWNRFAAATLVHVPFDRLEEQWPGWLLPAQLAHPLPFLAVLLLAIHPRPWHPAERAAVWTYLLWLLPYVLVSYYHRYAFPLIGVKAFLCLAAAARLGPLLRSRVWGRSWSDEGPAARPLRAPEAGLARGERAGSDLRPVFLMAVCIKAALLVADPTPLLFMGDSGAHIETAVRGYVPRERSYTYGLLVVRPLAAWPGTFVPLVAAQSLAGAATAWILAAVLVRGFGVRYGVAAAAAAACCVDPLMLIQERLVLTESFAQLGFAAVIAAVVWYLRSPAIRPLVVGAVAGVVLVSLRSVYLPAVFVATAAGPLLATAGSAGRPVGRRTGLAHLAVAAVLTAGLHVGYREWLSAAIGLPPAYLHERGFFQLAAWAPLVTPADAPDPRVEAVLRSFESSDHPLSSRPEREYHRWGREGLVARLVASYQGDRHAAAEAAARTASAAGVRDPQAVGRLAVDGYADYFRYVAAARDKLPAEQGRWSTFRPEYASELRTRFDWDARTIPAGTSTVRSYHLAAGFWYLFLLVSPAAGVASVAFTRPPGRPPGAICAALSALLLVTVCASMTTPCVRYLCPLGFTALIASGLLADAGFRAIALIGRRRGSIL